MELYAYWMQMHSFRNAPTGTRGDYWGNTLLQEAGFRLTSNSWECYELHLRLNPDPASGAGAVFEVWQNDALVRRFDDAGPLGFWIRDKFCPNDSKSAVCTTQPHTGAARSTLTCHGGIEDQLLLASELQ